jgi:hypothetical protein
MSLILNRFTVEDWNAFLEGYAGNPQDLIEEIKKSPEEFEDCIHGAAIRRASIQEEARKTSSSCKGNIATMKPLDGSGFYRMMNHDYTA